MKNIIRTKEEKKRLLLILIVATLIILVASLNALIMAKSKEIYEAFLQQNPNMNFDQFISFVIITFFTNIFEIAIISIFTFLTFNKIRFNKIYKIVFGVIVLLRIFNHILSFSLDSVFYYVLLVLYLIFFVLIITVPTKGRFK